MKTKTQKAKLKYKKETFFTVNYSDFEELVKKLYGIEYRFAAFEECSNDTVHAFYRVNGNLSYYELEDLEDFKSGEKQSFMASILLADLCKQGYIEPGNYLIDVCW